MHLTKEDYEFYKDALENALGLHPKDVLKDEEGNCYFRLKDLTKLQGKTFDTANLVIEKLDHEADLLGPPPHRPHRQRKYNIADVLQENGLLLHPGEKVGENPSAIREYNQFRPHLVPYQEPKATHENKKAAGLMHALQHEMKKEDETKRKAETFGGKKIGAEETEAKKRADPNHPHHEAPKKPNSPKP